METGTERARTGLAHSLHKSGIELTLFVAQTVAPQSTFFRLQGLSTPIQILSVARISAGIAAFIAPGFLTNKVYGFTTRQTHGAGVTANTTTAKPGAPEETLQAARLVASRDIVLGLALRDSTA